MDCISHLLLEQGDVLEVIDLQDGTSVPWSELKLLYALLKQLHTPPEKVVLHF